MSHPLTKTVLEPPERRDIARVTLRVGCEIEGDHALYLTKTLNISNQGVGVQTSSVLEEGRVYEMTLQLPLKPMTLKARVAHVGEQETGFDFVGLSREHERRLCDLLFQVTMERNAQANEWVRRALGEDF
jgi:hypothetical protein